MTDEPMTGEIVPAHHSRAVARCDVPLNLNEQLRLANALAGAAILPQHLRRSPENILAVMVGARALDVPLWQAFQEMHNIDGKLGISANMMRALWLRAGHSFRVVEREATHATVEATRIGDEPVRVTYTMEDAKTANIAGKGNWTKHPKAMLVARATSTCLREVGADVLMGMSYTPDEISDGAWVDSDLDSVKADVAGAAAVAATEAEVAGVVAEIDRIDDADVLRDLYRRVGARGLLDAEHDGLPLRKRISDRADAIRAEADVVDAEVVEDTPAPAEAECAKCDGTGQFEDKQCWICLGEGKAA